MKKNTRDASNAIMANMPMIADPAVILPSRLNRYAESVMAIAPPTAEDVNTMADVRRFIIKYVFIYDNPIEFFIGFGGPSSSSTF